MTIIARYFWATFTRPTANGCRGCRVDVVFVHQVKFFAIANIETMFKQTISSVNQFELPVKVGMG